MVSDPELESVGLSDMEELEEPNGPTQSSSPPVTPQPSPSRSRRSLPTQLVKKDMSRKPGRKSMSDRMAEMRRIKMEKLAAKATTPVVEEAVETAPSETARERKNRLGRERRQKLKEKEASMTNVPPPVKRGPGRPPKRRKDVVEEAAAEDKPVAASAKKVVVSSPKTTAQNGEEAAQEAPKAGKTVKGRRTTAGKAPGKRRTSVIVPPPTEDLSGSEYSAETAKGKHATAAGDVAGKAVRDAAGAGKIVPETPASPVEEPGAGLVRDANGGAGDENGAKKGGTDDEETTSVEHAVAKVREAKTSQRGTARGSGRGKAGMKRIVDGTEPVAVKRGRRPSAKTVKGAQSDAAKEGAAITDDADADVPTARPVKRVKTTGAGQKTTANAPKSAAGTGQQPATAALKTAVETGKTAGTGATAQKSPRMGQKSGSNTIGQKSGATGQKTTTGVEKSSVLVKKTEVAQKRGTGGRGREGGMGEKEGLTPLPLLRAVGDVMEVDEGEGVEEGEAFLGAKMLDELQRELVRYGRRQDGLVDAFMGAVCEGESSDKRDGNEMRVGAEVEVEGGRGFLKRERWRVCVNAARWEMRRAQEEALRGFAVKVSGVLKRGDEGDHVVLGDLVRGGGL